MPLMGGSHSPMALLIKNKPSSKLPQYTCGKFMAHQCAVAYCLKIMDLKVKTNILNSAQKKAGSQWNW